MTPTRRRLEVLMLVNPEVLRVSALRDYCEAFDLYSRHHVAFASCLRHATPPGVDYSMYDVLLVHSECPVRKPKRLEPDVVDAVRRHRGYKVLFIQDEYTQTEAIREWISVAGIDHVFTCVPTKDVPVVFPPGRFPTVTFATCRTGYVPAYLARLDEPPPLGERPYHVVYRCGRSLPYRYGRLGREKIEIGKVVRRACEERGVPVDIEWEQSRRIYGRAWTRFLQSGRATLGTESGCNVFDGDGSIARNLAEALRKDPDLSYEEAAARYFTEDNLGVHMNQISPKLFEFIAAGTALILYEGEYSGVLRPHEHYLPLRKDHSNLPETLDALEDLPRLEAMTRRARRDVIDSGKYSFREFVRHVDDQLDRAMASRAVTAPGRSPIPAGGPPPLTEALRAGAVMTDGRNGQWDGFLEEKKQNLLGMVQRRERKVVALKRQLGLT